MSDIRTSDRFGRIAARVYGVLPEPMQWQVSARRLAAWARALPTGQFVTLQGAAKSFSGHSSREWHVVAGGWSSLLSAANIPLSGVTISTMNLAAVHNLQYDLYTVEACGSVRSTVTRELAEEARRCARSSTYVLFKDAWHPRNSPRCFRDMYGRHSAVLWGLRAKLAPSPEEYANLLLQAALGKGIKVVPFNSSLFHVMVAIAAGAQTIVLHGVDFIGPPSNSPRANHFTIRGTQMDVIRQSRAHTEYQIRGGLNLPDVVRALADGARQQGIEILAADWRSPSASILGVR